MSTLSRKILSKTATVAGQIITDRTRERLIEILAAGLEGKVQTYRDIANRKETQIWWFDTADEYDFTHPQYYNQLPKEISRLIGHHTCQRPFVIETPNITITGQQGLMLTEEGDYLTFNFWNSAETRPATHGLAYDVLYGLKDGIWPEFGKPSPSHDVLPEIDIAVPLLSKHAKNYTHWTQDCLTQLEGVEEYITQTGRDPTIIIPSNPPAFIPESLEVLGYTDDQYIEWEFEKVKLRHAVLPSVRRCLSNTSDDYFRMISGLKWVRNQAHAGIERSNGNEHASNILISREDATRRRIINRKEVEDTLNDYGFVSYVPGRMSYTEQVRLFSQANFIIGVHGAGMINSIYATDASVVELYGNHYLPANYELAQGLGLSYGCLKCETANENNDIVVDIDELVNAINVMRENEESASV